MTGVWIPLLRWLDGKKTSTEQAAFEGSILKTDPELFAWMTGVFRDEERRAVRFSQSSWKPRCQGIHSNCRFDFEGSFATALFNELGNLQEHMHELLHERGQSLLVEKLGDLGINDIFVRLRSSCAGTCLLILPLPIQPTPT